MILITAFQICIKVDIDLCMLLSRKNYSFCLLFDSELDISSSPNAGSLLCRCRAGLN